MFSQYGDGIDTPLYITAFPAS